MRVYKEYIVNPLLLIIGILGYGSGLVPNIANFHGQEQLLDNETETGIFSVFRLSGTGR